MTKCEIFLDYFDSLLEESNKKFDDLPQEVKDFYIALQTSKTVPDKPTFTAIGLQVLEFMQQSSAKSFKAKDISEGIALSSRKISGSMRKLVNDGYVEKYGESPANYMITNKGKEINLTDYKETIQNEEN